MRRRIVICLGLLLALCLTGDAIALLSLNRSIERITELAESHRIQTIRSSLNSSGIRLERDMLSHLVRQETDDEHLRDGIWRFQDSLDQCSTCHHDPRVSARLHGIQTAFDAWVDQSAMFFARGEGAGLSPEQKSVLDLASQVPMLTTQMVDQAHVRLKIKSDEVKATVHRAWITLCATLLLALIGGGVVALHLQRSLTGPLYGLLDWVSRSRDGGPEVGPPSSGDEEFLQLGEAFYQAYRDLKFAQNGIVQAEKMAAIGQLAAGVAHEVNNPLASIAAIVHIARSKSTSEEDRAQMDLIMDHVERISSIVRGILSFSRPVGDDPFAYIELPALLDHATALLHYDRRTSTIEIVTECEPRLPAINASADKLVIVFTNVILNAIDAISEKEDGRGTLRITARTEGDSVLLRFKDDGAGMSEDSVSDAFQPFFTTKQPGAGTGLGLWICYEIVRTHGGSITIDSKLGEGTTITILLPRTGEPAAV